MQPHMHKHMHIILPASLQHYIHIMMNVAQSIAKNKLHLFLMYEKGSYQVLLFKLNFYAFLEWKCLMLNFTESDVSVSSKVFSTKNVSKHGSKQLPMTFCCP